MQALSDLFANKSLMLAAAVIALLVGAVFLLLMFRLAFGRRLRMPGSGRGRPPRLGVVDAFDLDRQRQLVIVRRDNVEHLIMIGGPNDLVIESEIIRAEAREGRIRDKEPKEQAQPPAGAVWPPELDAALRPAPGPAPAPPQRKTQPPLTAGVAPRETEPVAVAAGFDAPIAPPSAAPVLRQPVFPLPPRRSPPPFAPPPQRIPSQREPSLGRSDLAQRERAEAGASAQSGFPRASLATPFLRSPPPRPGQDLAAKPAGSANAAEGPSSIPSAAAPPPAASSESTAEAPPEVVQAPAAPEAEPSAPLQAAIAVALAPAKGSATALKQDPLDSIEEEMAKLLGRGPSS